MAVNPLEGLRAALQQLLDAEGDGYQLAHYVVVMGIQKIDAMGKIDARAWMAVPAEQADYISDGLIAAAEDMRADADVEGD